MVVHGLPRIDSPFAAETVNKARQKVLREPPQGCRMAHNLPKQTQRSLGSKVLGKTVFEGALYCADQDESRLNGLLGFCTWLWSDYERHSFDWRHGTPLAERADPRRLPGLRLNSFNRSESEAVYAVFKEWPRPVYSGAS
jgi:hypothetical protein